MDFDLIVVGGGPVGLALACAARARPCGLRVALVAQEASAPALGDAPDARVYALSPGNVEFLRGMGAWDAMEPSGVTPIRAMRVHGDRPGSRIEFDAYRAGAPELAWTVEDARLQQALWRTLRGGQGVEVVGPAQCESIEADDGRASVRLRDGRALRASLVAGADGASSFVRAQAGIEVSSRDYGQAAVVANFACAKAHGEVAFQWFQGGPVLAALPLPGRAISMIWSLPPAEAARIASLDAPSLCAAAAQAMQGELGDLALLTPARSYPLRRLSAHRLVGRRVALVGDAAHVIHPLAGQGLNLGLQDVRALAAVLGDRPSVREPGDPLVLRAYERARAEPILAMDFMVDGLYRLFGAQAEGLARLRNAGLNLTDRLPVVKNVLVRRAMT